ncbi:Dyp-type peroxidase [Glaciibacter psychrotolerans]|uniref:Dye decolorizing peroxidase n=1 Tax=Glaciibacter psychrotolerans TaxID=670054 RepID=A0A7Z0EGL5_9MICO|nr:Dyp-type peroxidase [Leifsonia psychrotolerans]NYJ20875.1 dye decolorizing peroxidase [Leifsonia psychrotolerans]
MANDQDASPGRGGLSRRRLLLGGAVAGVGAVTAIAADLALRPPAPSASGGVATEPAAESAAATSDSGSAASESLHGGNTVPFYGRHQAGIATEPQAHVTYVSLTLLDHVDRAALTRLMRLLTDDAARLTQGRPALADSEPELGTAPARLTVTFGFGPGFIARAGGVAPDWLGPLPPFGIDRLDPAWAEGDLLIQVASDDALTRAHAIRMLLKDTRTFASVGWTQAGFRRARGTEQSGTTMRNLFGQVDGTVNLTPGTDDFDELVWCPDGWLAGGTSLVLRRIQMNLDTWDRLDRGGREQSVGRFLSNGAPLTGSGEHDEPDFTATTPIGFPVIPEFSHLARARSENAKERIFRRGYNYDETPLGGSVSNSGLLFASFQADVTAQFVPIQRRLDELDLLNEWTTPIGSSVFAVPPGCAEGGFVGETLLG